MSNVGMTRRFWRLGALCCLLFVVAPRVAHACSCMASGPACQAFWKTDAVFDATVLAITPSGEQYGNGPAGPLYAEHLVRLQVKQAWKGVQPGELDVVTRGTDAACGYDFKLGARYLVFAHRHPAGRLSVSRCSATKPFDGAGEDADFLASLSSPAAGGRVLGSVKSLERLFDMGPSRERAVETRLRLSGGGHERSILSTGGRFEFTALDPGSYRLELQVPEGHSTSVQARYVEIPNARACAREDYWVSPAGRIIGRAVGPDGRALIGLNVEATAADASPHPIHGLSTTSVQTDGDGNFEIRELPPGKYVVGVNLQDLPSKYNPYARTLYPSDGSDPHVLTLSLGQTRDLGTWRMPSPLPVVRVEGVVLWQDGTPAPGMFVGAWDRTGNPTQVARGAGNTKTGGDGRFVIELRRGRLYALSVDGGDSGKAVIAVAAPRVDTTGPVGLVRIVIRGER